MHVHNGDNHEHVQQFDEVVSIRQQWQFATLGYYIIIFFSLDCSYYYSNHNSHHISPIGNQSFGVSQVGLKSDGVFQCYYLGFIKATLWHIRYAFLELGPSLNEHHLQYYGSIIVIRFTISLAHLCAFSMSYYVQC